MVDLLESGRRDHEPVAATVPVLKFSWHFDLFDVQDPADVSEVLQILSVASAGLATVTSGKTQNNFYSIELVGQNYIVERKSVSISSLEIKSGSIIVIGTIAVTFALGVYNGVAKYPNFKAGLAELRNDIPRIFHLVRKGKGRLYKKYLQKVLDRGVAGNSEARLEVEEVSEKEIVEILEKAAKKANRR